MISQPVRRFGKQSYPGVCGGPLTTVLRVGNDSPYPVAMEVQTAQGWKNMGILSSQGSEMFWRASGERWRLYDTQGQTSLGEAVTSGSKTNLYAGPSPGGFKLVNRY
jgi:hypothetical protein